MATQTAAPETAAPAQASLVSQARKAMGGNVRQYGMIIALLLLVLLFQILTDGLFLQPRNVTSLLVQNGYVLILAIGMVMVIIAGHIDLSVGSVAAFTGATVAIAMREFSIPWFLAIALGLLVGAIVGAWQGYWVAYVGIPAFIVTLAGMLLFRGIDLMILNAQSVPVPSSFQTIANGYLPEMGPNTGYHNPTVVLSLLVVVVLFVLEMRRRADLAKHDMEVPTMALSLLKVGLLGGAVVAFGLLLASYKGVPVVGLIVGGLIVIYSFVMRKTVFGRHVYAVGGNAGAARLSGVDTKRVDFMVMVNMGVLAAVAGMVFTAYLNASNPKDGVGFELDAIAAVFIGGAAVAGGVGTVLGAIVGGLVMGVLNLGLANLSVDSNFIQIIKGMVLLLAVAFDVRSKIAGRPSFIGFMISAVTRNQPSRPAAPAAAETMTTSLSEGDMSRAHIPSGAPTVPTDLPSDLEEMDRPGAPVGTADGSGEAESPEPGPVEVRK